MSPCLFNLHAEYIIQNAGLDEAQTGIKIAGKSINNLRYADFIFWAQKSLQMVTAAMKLKDACSLEKK